MKKLLSIVLITVIIVCSGFTVNAAAEENWDTVSRNYLCDKTNSLWDVSITILSDAINVNVGIENGGSFGLDYAQAHFNNAKGAIADVLLKLVYLGELIDGKKDIKYSDKDGTYYLRETYSELLNYANQMNGYTFSSVSTVAASEAFSNLATELNFSCLVINTIAKNGQIVSSGSTSGGQSGGDGSGGSESGGTETESDSSLGTTVSSAIVLSNDKWYTQYWTNKNYDLNCYNKITIASRGYITFTISKPYETDGDISYYKLTLYDSKGNVAWAGYTGGIKNSFGDSYEFKIGLNKGTYYMDIDPAFFVSSKSSPIVTKHKYKFTKSDYWEIESNNDLSKATALTLGKKYNAVYVDETSLSTSAKDYFKFYLTKGRSYKIQIFNYNELDAGTSIIELFDPNNNELRFNNRDGKDSGNSRYWIIQAEKTGWHYLLFRNDSNEQGVNFQLLIEQQKISSSTCTAKLSTTKYTYNGSKKTPKVVVKNASGKTLNENVDYTVTYPSSRKNVGKYKVVIKFKGSYTGTKNLYFTINPAKTSVKKLSSGKKSLTVAITKKSTQTTGYEVQYSTSKKFKSAKVKKIKSYKTTSLTIKSLKAKKTYYVRVRTFKKVDGKTYYSSWSSAKSKKTK